MLQNKQTANVQVNVHPGLHYGYILTLFIVALSGFAQMPIFKRYYIADIPGLGWLAQFYVTHLVHYLAASLILGYFAFRFVDFILSGRKNGKLTRSGLFRMILLSGLVITGLLLVIKNFSGYVFSPEFIIFLDFSHLGLTICFLVTALVCKISKKKWTESH